MKKFKFEVTEVSLAGSTKREILVEARTVLSAHKKLLNIRGNRDFQGIKIKSINNVIALKPQDFFV